MARSLFHLVYMYRLILLVLDLIMRRFQLSCFCFVLFFQSEFQLTGKHLFFFSFFFLHFLKGEICLLMSGFRSCGCFLNFRLCLSKHSAVCSLHSQRASPHQHYQPGPVHWGDPPPAAAAAQVARVPVSAASVLWWKLSELVFLAQSTTRDYYIRAEGDFHKEIYS